MNLPRETEASLLQKENSLKEYTTRKYKTFETASLAPDKPTGNTVAA